MPAAMAAEVVLRSRAQAGDEGLARAIVLAIGLHLLLLVLFWLLGWLDLSRPTPAAAGEPITADLNLTDAEAEAARQALAHETPEPLTPPLPEPEPESPEETAPLPQPIPEPLPQEAPVERQVDAQEFLPIPDIEEQDEVREDAISEQTRAREQEEKRRQEQINLSERERQKQAEERQRLAAQAEAEKKKQEREKKLVQIRAEREKLQRQARLSEQRLRQIADRQAQAASQSASEAAAQADAAASGSPPAGSGGVDQGLLNQYIAAIQAAVTSRWTRPDNIPNLPCKMRITQLPGGEVMSVDFDSSCPYDEAGKRSVEAAVLKAQPLPYAGFEPVFSRRLNFTFRPSN